MSALPKKKLTEAEYLAVERTAECKSEFYAGEMFAMAGATFDHNRAKDNLARHLGNQLDGGPCFPLTSDMRVKVSATGLCTYPDIVVVCGEPVFDGATRDTVLNPTVVVEVLSDSTERYDRGTKFRHYQQIPSLQEYLLVAQDEPACERFVRQPDGTWNLTTVIGLAGELAFASIPARVPLADIYAGVAFPATLLR